MPVDKRKIVFNKYGGKCAYCGCELQKGWHIDHIEPMVRKTRTVYQHWKHEDTGEVIQQNEGLRSIKNKEDYNKWKYVARKEVPDGFRHPERNVLQNMIPACASCNINKHGFSVEDFREMIEGFMKHLNERNTQYKLAKRYGLIQETVKPVVFYFETFKTQTNVE